LRVFFLFHFHPFAISLILSFCKQFVSNRQSLLTSTHHSSSIHCRCSLAISPSSALAHPTQKCYLLLYCLLSVPKSAIMAYQYQYQQSYYQSSPIAVPSKPQYASYYPPQSQGYSVSPPEPAESVSSSTGLTQSYGHSGYSAASSSYAGSQSGEYDSTSSANGVDMQEYMQDRFTGAFDPIPLDRTLAVQAQT